MQKLLFYSFISSQILWQISTERFENLQKKSDEILNGEVEDLLRTERNLSLRLSQNLQDQLLQFLMYSCFSCSEFHVI